MISSAVSIITADVYYILKPFCCIEIRPVLKMPQFLNFPPGNLLVLSLDLEV
jgi:hypothetical protein